MYSLSDLLDKLAPINQSRIVVGGYGLWIVAGGQVGQGLEQSLTEHGGLRLAEAGTQSLWFFFSNEVFRGLAKLQIWARVNPLRISVEVFPATFLVGWDMTRSLSLAPELCEQKVDRPEELEVRVHPKFHRVAGAMPGLSLETARTLPGLAALDWRILRGDPSYAYDSQLAWHFVIKPLGNPLDKDFAQGWRHICTQCEGAVRRLGLKLSYSDKNMVISLDSLRSLRQWCREVLQVVRVIKDDPAGIYWPCVMVAVAATDRYLGEEAIKRINLDWNRLSPDYPHLTYRDGFLLGSEFQVNALSYFSERAGIENWCYVTLAGESEAECAVDCLNIELPQRLLVSNEATCFYCGLKTHQPADCPSHALGEINPGVWQWLSRLNMADLERIAASMDKALSGEQTARLGELLTGSDDAAMYVQAVFENCLTMQLRMLHRIWRSRGKDWPEAFDTLGPEEGDYIWPALEHLRQGSRSQAEQLVAQAVSRAMRNYQPRSLQGFLDMEKGDATQALFYFQEAERLAYTPVQRSLMLLYQGRMHEVAGEFERALGSYKKAEQHSPGWLETIYRQAICLVKMGFADHAWGVLSELILRTPWVFNRLLIDPETERGRNQVLAGLGELWARAEERADEAKRRFEDLAGRVPQWFPPEHPYLKDVQGRIEELRKIVGVHNYVAIHQLVHGVMALETELKAKVEGETRLVERKVEQLTERLIAVQRESAWFPFPKLLRDFNRDFNFCAEKINWIRSQRMQLAENLRRAQNSLMEVEERLKVLGSRLVTLRIVRDGTFFVLLLGRNFIWLELIGLGLSLVLVPILVYLAQGMFADWIGDLVLKQKWQLQKGLVIILSVAALGLAALRTGIGFDKKKRQVFDLEFERSVAAQEERRTRRRKAQRVKRAAQRKGGGQPAPAPATAQTQNTKGRR